MSQTVTTVTFEAPGYVDLQALDKFFQDLLWEKTIQNRQQKKMDVFRLKVTYLAHCGSPVLSSSCNGVFYKT